MLIKLYNYMEILGIAGEIMKKRYLLLITLMLCSCSKSITLDEARNIALSISQTLKSENFNSPTKYTLSSKTTQNGYYTTSNGSSPISVVAEETTIYDGDNYQFYSVSKVVDNGELTETKVWLYGENDKFYTVISTNDRNIYYDVDVNMNDFESAFKSNYALFSFILDPSLISVESIEQILRFMDYSNEDFEKENYSSTSLSFKSSKAGHLITEFSYTNNFEEDNYGMISKGTSIAKQQITFTNNLLSKSNMEEEREYDVYYEGKFLGKEKTTTNIVASYKYSAKFKKPNLNEFTKVD